MRMETDDLELDLDLEDEQDGSGGFLGVALLALALGAGAAMLFAPAEGAKTRQAVGERLKDWRGGAEEALERVQRELKRRESRRRRERRSSAILGLAVGAGLAALLTPESGPNVRRRITQGLKRSEDLSDIDRVVREPQPDPEPA
ncbi:MAG: YtxH domain-containing protein [Gemmatimonadales bacterium]|jgi:gas vesicle protein